MPERNTIEELKNKLYGMSVEDFLDIFIFGRHFFMRKNYDDDSTIYEFWYDTDEELTRGSILLEVKYLMSNNIVWSFDKESIGRGK